MFTKAIYNEIHSMCLVKYVNKLGIALCCVVAKDIKVKTFSFTKLFSPDDIQYVL
jgi:hypothetical protein